MEDLTLEDLEYWESEGFSKSDLIYIKQKQK